MKRVLLVVGASRIECRAWRESNPNVRVDELGVFDNEYYRYGGLGHIANDMLAMQSWSEEDGFGMVHADTTFPDGTDAFYDAVREKNAVAGIVGITEDGSYAWSHTGACDVWTLDGCAVFFDPTKLPRAPFDTDTFDKAHLVIEDFCMLARVSCGQRIMVPSAPAGHAGGRTSNAAWQEEHAKYASLFRSKWSGHRVLTT